MAYSPSPRPTALSSMASGTVNPSYRINRLSPSPPPQQSINKRDKKRMAMNERLAEISNNFAENRDALYRDSLRSFHNDIHYISTAKLYDNEPLDEDQSGFIDDLSFSAAGSSAGSVRAAHLHNTNTDQLQKRLGKHAARFIQSANDALEQKDAKLVEVASNFNFNIEQFQNDYIWSVSVAQKEHERLMDTLRQRLISNVQAKKASLQRDKEKLDIADTNALLYNPNQFSINSVASPAGLQNNRKTRHTRHRFETEEVDSANAVNGKRKRRGPLEGETTSPPRDLESLNGYKSLEVRQEDQPAAPPIYTIDKLFTEKELSAHLKYASLDVVNEQQRLKRRKADGASGNAPAESSEEEENGELDNGLSADGTAADVFLEAPTMERTTTNQSRHETRSTRNNNVKDSASRENLGELAGRQAAAELLGTYSSSSHSRDKRKEKEEEYNRAAALSHDEVEQDFALMEQAMRAEDERQASDSSLLDEVCGERPDWTHMPKID